MAPLKRKDYRAVSAAERRRLGKLNYPVDSTPLLEQIRYRHEVFNAVKAEIEIPELPEQEIIQRVLYLAHPKNTTIDQKAAAMLNCADKTSLSHGYSGDWGTAWAHDEKPKYAIWEWWDSIAEIRGDFRKAVLAVFRNPLTARRKYGKWIRDALDQIVVVPRLVWDGHTGKTELRYFSMETSAACGYALMLLLDEGRPYGSLLRLCKLEEECERPFLAVHAPTGSPPTAYCSDDCKAIAKRNLTAARQAAFRERNKKAKSRRRTKR